MENQPAQRQEFFGLKTNRSPAGRERIYLWTDPSAMLRREQAEHHLTYLRWIVIAGATLYLVFARNLEYLPLAGAALLAGVVLNSILAYLVYQKRFSLAWSIVAQVVDILLLQLYTAALPGGTCSYLPLYTTMVVTSTIRFGIVGTLSSGLIGVLLDVATAGVTSGEAPSSLMILVSILADAILLAYFAYLVRLQHTTLQQNASQLEEKIYEITVLHQVSTAVHDLKSEDALQNIVEITTKVLGFQRAALFLTHSVGTMLPHEYYSRDQEAQHRGLPDVHMDRALFELVLQKEAPIVIDGSQGLPDMDRGAVLQVAVPLHGHEAPIGVLIADRNDRGNVEQSDKEMLSSLAQSAVMAIENASLHRRIRRMANHDGVTDLFNHRYFQEALRATIAESEDAWPISLLMIEIDKFKRYNDTYGHRQGDTALISLAQALEETAAVWDGLVARYGGDEFVVILPRVDRAEGEQAAQTIKERACQVAGELLREHNLPTISLSVGVATYPDDALSATDLIESADRAMYVAKRSGGNQVCAYSQELLSRTLPNIKA
ncbi:MAG: GGDEF domain-containing protein [Anaerolineae bacterium]|nr:GGDEF domain-containing protein [Anaerolineae bacterium]